MNCLFTYLFLFISMVLVYQLKCVTRVKNI